MAWILNAWSFRDVHFRIPRLLCVYIPGVPDNVECPYIEF